MSLTLDPSLSEPLYFTWGEIRWIVNKDLVPGAEMTFGVVTIHPGAQNDRHMHPNCEEILYVLSGSCEHSRNEERIHLKPGMAIHIPRGTWHNAAVLGEEPCRMTVSYSSPERQTILKLE